MEVGEVLGFRGVSGWGVSNHRNFWVLGTNCVGYLIQWWINWGFNWVLFMVGPCSLGGGCDASHSAC